MINIEQLKLLKAEIPYLWFGQKLLSGNKSDTIIHAIDGRRRRTGLYLEAELETSKLPRLSLLI